MPLLVEVGFTQIGPKSSEDGTKEYIIACDFEQALAYIDKKHMNDALADTSKSEVFPTEDYWRSHPHKRAEAERLGLDVESCGHVEGASNLISLLWEGTTWQDVDENSAYYGVTQWDWSNRKEITEADAEILIRLGVARDIRELNNETI